MTAAALLGRSSRACLPRVRRTGPPRRLAAAVGAAHRRDVRAGGRPGRPDRPVPRCLRDARLPGPRTGPAGRLVGGRRARLRAAAAGGRVGPVDRRSGPARGARHRSVPALRRRAGRLRCGIESLFASQDEARRLEQDLADGAVARVRIDGRGNAAVVGLRPGS
jgi:hypothetical protein